MHLDSQQPDAPFLGAKSPKPPVRMAPEGLTSAAGNLSLSLDPQQSLLARRDRPKGPDGIDAVYGEARDQKGFYFPPEVAA